MINAKRKRSAAFLVLLLAVAVALAYWFIGSRSLNASKPSIENPPQSSLTLSKNFDSHLSSPVLVTPVDAVAIQDTSVQPSALVSGRMQVENSEFTCNEGSIRLVAINEAHAMEMQADNFSITDLYNSATASAASIIAGEIALDGQVTFSEIPLGLYGVDAYCNDYLFARGPKIIEVTENSIQHHEWVFTVGIRLAVSVADASGRPVPNASLYLSRGHTQSGNTEPANTEPAAGAEPTYRQAMTTDHNGQHTFAGLEAGSYRLAFKNSQSLGQENLGQENLGQENNDVVEEIWLSAEQDLHSVQITIPSSGSIEINVSNSSGQPVEGLVFYSEEGSAVYKSVAQESGRYLISPVPWGVHQLSYSQLSTPAITLKIYGRERVSVEDSLPTILNIELDAPTGFIEGRILDENGRPISGVLVQVIHSQEDHSPGAHSLENNASLPNAAAKALLDPNAFAAMNVNQVNTDQNGYFKIDKLGLVNNYQLEARYSHAGFLRSETVVVGDFVEIVFPLSASIGGRVVQGDGKAVNDFVIVLSNRSTGLRASQTFSNQNGEFMLENVVPGSLHLYAVGVETEIQGMHAVELSAGQQLQGLTIVLSDLP